MFNALSPNFSLALAVFLLLLGVVEPNSGVVGFYLLGVYCIFQCNLQYLPTLFICHISPNSLEIVASYLNMSRLDLVSSLSIFERALPNFSDISQIIFCLYVIISLFLKPFKFKNSRLRLLFWLWAICVIGGVINTVFSLLEGNEMWTRGLRAVLTVGCCFYGLLLAQRSKIGGDLRLASVWLWLILVFGILVTLHVFWSHVLFWLVSIASLLMAFQVRYRNSQIFRFSALAYLPVSFGSSLTMLVISFGTLLAVWLSAGKSQVRRFFVRKSIVLLLILGPFVSLGLGSLTDSLGFGDNAEMVSSEASLSDRAVFKLTEDRLPLWTSAYSQIVEGPFWFPTSGRLLQVTHFSEEVEWSFGAHNTYLEILRNNGLFFGAILLFVIINLLIMTLGNRESGLIIYSLLGVSLCTTAGFGLFLGDFVVEPTVGPIFWIVVGVVIWRLQQLSGLPIKAVSAGR